MLYARMNDDGDRFEPQRNLMTHTYSLDRGGSVAADSKGNVFVVWHANSEKDEIGGEAGRAVWVATSNDDGATFAAETRANAESTGACGCCGLRAYVAPSGVLYVLYRSAEGSINRDMQLLASKDHGKSFSLAMLDPWEVQACVMSGAALFGVPGKTYAAWETEQKIKFARIDSARHSSQAGMITFQTSKGPCKHPAMAVNSAGYSLLIWTEGTGWNKGGSLGWQLFDPNGIAVPEHHGRIDDVPVWSFGGVLLGRMATSLSSTRRTHLACRVVA